MIKHELLSIVDSHSVSAFSMSSLFVFKMSIIEFLPELPPLFYILIIGLIVLFILIIIGAILNRKKNKLFRIKIKNELLAGSISSQEADMLNEILSKQGAVNAERSWQKIIEKKKNEYEINNILSDAHNSLQNGEINTENYLELKQNIHNKGVKWAQLYMKQSILSMQLLQTFISKYGAEKGVKLYHKQFFLGMTKEELIDSIGDPNKIETEVMKTKTKEIWIYGNKSSGDVFVFEDGHLARFKDR
jgi:uncharacterized surface anchored protein